MKVSVSQVNMAGYDLEAMERDTIKIAKRYQAQGMDFFEAMEQAEAFVEYYKHTYRKFA